MLSEDLFNELVDMFRKKHHRKNVAAYCGIMLFSASPSSGCLTQNEKTGIQEVCKIAKRGGSHSEAIEALDYVFNRTRKPRVDKK